MRVGKSCDYIVKKKKKSSKKLCEEWYEFTKNKGQFVVHYRKPEKLVVLTYAVYIFSRLSDEYQVLNHLVLPATSSFHCCTIISVHCASSVLRQVLSSS